MMDLTREMVEELNETLEDTCFMYEFRESPSSAEVRLRDTRGLEVYTIYLTDEMYNRIEEFFAKKNAKVHYNNTRSIFWIM